MTCVAVFEHLPGRGGHTESYIVGDVQDVLAQIEWGERKLGEFVGIVPVWDGLPVDPYFVTVISTSLQSQAARDKMARDRLKELLPDTLHSLITLARRMNRRPKRDWLPPFTEESEAPDWWRGREKGELFVERTLSDDERRRIAVWMYPLDFWNVATGRVDWQEIDDLMRVRQLGFVGF